MIPISDYRAIGTVVCTGTRSALKRPKPTKQSYVGDGVLFVASSWSDDGVLALCEWQLEGEAGSVSPDPDRTATRYRSVLGLRDPHSELDADPFRAYRLGGIWLDRYLCGDEAALKAVPPPTSAVGIEGFCGLCVQPIGDGKRVALDTRSLLPDRVLEHPWRGVFDQELGCLVRAERIHARFNQPLVRVDFADFTTVRSLPLPRTIVTTTFHGMRAGEEPSGSTTVSYATIEPSTGDRLADRIWQPPPGTKILERNE